MRILFTKWGFLRNEVSDHCNNFEMLVEKGDADALLLTELTPSMMYAGLGLTTEPRAQYPR
jgi:hypothetical protein